MIVYFSEKLVSDNVTEFVAKGKLVNHITHICLCFATIIITVLIIITFHNNSYVFAVDAVIIVVALFTLISLPFNPIQEESILIIHDFGIQIRRRYFSGREDTKFFDHGRINKVFIHEYIQGSGVCFCLAFDIVNENKLVLIFNQIYPGLYHLQQVYVKCVTNIEDYERASEK